MYSIIPAEVGAVRFFEYICSAVRSSQMYSVGEHCQKFVTTICCFYRKGLESAISDNSTHTINNGKKLLKQESFQ